MGKLTKVWTGTEWVHLSPAAYGPTGPTGPIGPTGPTGPVSNVTGPTGATGPGVDFTSFFLMGA